MLQPPEFTSENVEGFPVKEILVRFLSHIYDIQVAVIDSVNFGLPVARLRSYQIGRHKLKTLGPSKSLADHTHALQRPVAFGWEELFWMSQIEQSTGEPKTAIQDEVLTEWRWATNRPLSQWRLKHSQEPEGQTKPVQGQTGQEFVGLKCEEFQWTLALTEAEFHNSKDYKKRWPNMCFNLNQSAEERGSKSTTKFLQTFIHIFGLMFTYSPKIGDTPRWLFASEALVAMGFPVHPDLVMTRANPEAFVLTSFNVERRRKPADARAQCGNSDSLLLAAVSELYSLIHFRCLGMVWGMVPLADLLGTLLESRIYLLD